MNKQAALEHFRSIPEKSLGEWRYRVFGAGEQTLLVIPGGELVNDFGFEFALAMADAHSVVYPAYPRAFSIEDLADGLRAILDAEGIRQVAILGVSFGGAVAQIFVRRYPNRVSELILSNTGVPLPHLAMPVHITYWIAKMIPWTLTSKLLRKPLLKTVDQSGTDHPFWASYLEELFSARLTKADILANILLQHDYHRRFRFTSEDLKDWNGRELIAESDTDVIGPSRRKALRDTYPQAKVHTFHNAGHAPMFTRYAEYLRMVEDFLN